MQKVFLLLLLIYYNLISLSCSENLCPPIEDVQPCVCVSVGEEVRLDCLSINSIEQLRKGLAGIKSNNRIYVDFIRAKLDHIPSDLFKGLDVTRLSFTNSDLKSFGDEGRSALEGLEDIIEEFSLHFSFSEENELKFLNVSGLKVLEILQIEGNGLRSLGNDWFRDGPKNVKNIFLMTNFIEELGDKAFANLVNVKNLWMTGNRFRVVKRSMFPSPANYLVSLDLANNGILSLPENIFTSMPVLREVILAENGITTIPETTWVPVWKQLTRLYLEMNPLECDSHIEWMFKMPRPFVVKGQCIAPKDRRNQDLKQIIDDNADIEDDYYYFKSSG